MLMIGRLIMSMIFFCKYVEYIRKRSPCRAITERIYAPFAENSSDICLMNHIDGSCKYMVPFMISISLYGFLG